MATTRLRVTVSEELAAYIREQIATGRYASVSALVSDALDTLRTVDPLQLLIDSMIAETGEPDAEAEAWADGVAATAERASHDPAGRDGDRGTDAA